MIILSAQVEPPADSEDACPWRWPMRTRTRRVLPGKLDEKVARLRPTTSACRWRCCTSRAATGTEIGSGPAAAFAAGGWQGQRNSRHPQRAPTVFFTPGCADASRLGTDRGSRECLQHLSHIQPAMAHFLERHAFLDNRLREEVSHLLGTQPWFAAKRQPGGGGYHWGCE